MYADFARVYDRLMADVDYEAWAAHYGRLLGLCGVGEDALVCECACGTGSLTAPLARRYRMTGVDLSQEMLSVAADKLRDRGLEVPLIRQDMQALRLHRAQDAVLCTCDGVNYLTGPRALPRFLAAAFRALRPGGALCFDVSSLHKLSQVLGNGTQVSTQGDCHYIWYNAWQQGQRLLHMRLHLYLRGADGRFDHFVEEQVQRAYAAGELDEALRAAGFEDVRVFGDMDLRPPSDQALRLHLCARRPKASDTEGTQA